MRMSLSDRIVMELSPERGAKRLLARFQAEQLGKLTASSSGPSHPPRAETRWRAASRVLRALTGWNPHLGSGRSDLPKPERDRMAARSYDAHRNFMVGRAAIARCRTSIVGTGLTMHPDVDTDVLGLSEEQAEELHQQIEREWALYSDNPYEIDIEATLDFAGLQSLSLVTALLAGDCFALTPFEERAGGNYGLKCQLIDPARVSNKNDGPDTTTLVDGVELALNGFPIAIHIRNRHPDDRVEILDTWTRREVYSEFGTRRVLQIWNDKDRIGATRGAPYLAPILEPLQNLEQYSRSELIAAVVASLFTVFIKKTQGQFDDKGNPIPFLQGQTAPTTTGASTLALGSGAIVDLAPGEEPSIADPKRPNAQYDPFFLSVVKQMGAALEIPMEELLLHYASSYSAARGAMLQAWRFYTMRRWWLTQQFCQPFYGLWFDEAVARGRIQVSEYADPQRRAAYQRAIWIGPARGSMDENQEADAAKKRIDAGISNETIETAQMTGENWLTVYRTRAREVKRRRADGLELASGAQGKQTGRPGRPQNGGEPGDEPEDQRGPARPPAPTEADEQ